MEAAAAPRRTPPACAGRVACSTGSATGRSTASPPLAAILALLTVAAIIWQVIDKAWPAIEHFGIAFLWDSTWNPVTDVYGAREYIIGTLVTSFGAILIAAPLSIAIGLFLSELAPPAIRGPIGSLVDMLAAVPSVVIGLWGIYVLLPVRPRARRAVASHVVRLDPDLRRAVAPAGVFPAMLVLAIMATPITSSICRELFASVPGDLEEAAIGLGATRWEMVRGVVHSERAEAASSPAIILGLGRALGEAIAVTQVIGNGSPLQLNIFAPGNTLASQLANQYSSAISPLSVAVARLPRPDPARDHVRREPRRPADRAPLRRGQRTRMIDAEICRSRRPGARGGGCG